MRRVGTVKFSGVFIAPVTPLEADGRINHAEFERLLNFLLEGGVDGVCIAGGTSEYPRFDLPERCELISAGSSCVRGRGLLLAAVGAASYSRTLRLGQHAKKAEADALLLPMPYFYRYDQGDLEHFCRQVSRSLSAPLLLYNLPWFTSELEPETAIRLLRSEPNLVGIKDSGADEDSLRKFTEARQDHEFALLIGTDELILEALETGWDGSISGLGNICPELLSALLRSFRKGDRDKARECQELIRRISVQFKKFPVPWAIRAGLEVRGIRCGSPTLPLSPERIEQIKEFQAWFERLLDSELNAAISPASLTAASA